MDFLRKATDAMERLQTHGLAAPSHAVIRAAVLLGDEDIVYLDSDVATGPDGGRVSGDIHIFTPTRVIRLRLDGSAGDPVDPAGSTVGADTWSRSLLERVELVGGDHPWSEVPQDRLLSATGYALTYRNGEKVTIPADSANAMKPQREQALRLLGALIRNLVPGG